MVVRTAPPMVVQMAVTMAPPKVHCLADPLTDLTECLRAC